MNFEVDYTGVTKKFYDLTTEVVAAAGYVLYDMDYIKSTKTLRVYIMDSETNTAVIEDCVAVDRAFSEPMESLDWVPDDIVLEVSSPGMYRVLKTREHFEQNIGQRILIQTSKKLKELLPSEALDKKAASTKKIVCNLVELGNDSVTVSLDSDFDLKLNINDISKVTLEPEV